jgi:site-specific DNA-methyltransferase (adenine-specific)
MEIKNNNIYLGDCLELMKHIPDKHINMILCDLPYGTTACKWDVVIPFEPLWEQYTRIIKDKGAIVLFGQEPFSSLLRTSNLSMYRYDWIWKKEKPSNFQLMNYQCGRVQENIMVFSKAKACYTSNNNSMVYYPQKTKRDKPRKANVKIYGNTESNILHEYKNGNKDNIKTYEYKLPTSILNFNNPTHKQHPTQKPIPLLEYLIKTYTNENEVVLDSCIGSGSTCLACMNTNRNFIGFEKKEEYFNLSLKNINAWNAEHKD